jgi:hypothetical protein
MQVRFYIDPQSGAPHIYGHDVSESEVEEVLERPVEDRPGTKARELRSAALPGVGT